MFLVKSFLPQIPGMVAGSPGAVLYGAAASYATLLFFFAPTGFFRTLFGILVIFIVAFAVDKVLRLATARAEPKKVASE